MVVACGMCVCLAQEGARLSAAGMAANVCVRDASAQDRSECVRSSTDRIDFVLSVTRQAPLCEPAYVDAVPPAFLRRLHDICSRLGVVSAVVCETASARVRRRLWLAHNSVDIVWWINTYCMYTCVSLTSRSMARDLCEVTCG